MIIATILYIIFRPFFRKAAAERKRLVAEQRIARHTAIENRRNGRKVKFTDEERAYMAQHAVSPYRQD